MRPLKLLLLAAAFLILASFHAALARPDPGRMARVLSGVGKVVVGIVVGGAVGVVLTAAVSLVAIPNPRETHGDGGVAAIVLTILGGILGAVLGALAGGWLASRNGDGA